MIIRITLLAARQEPTSLGKCSARLALQSVSRRTAFPPRRDFDGAASRYLYPVACPRFLTARPMIIRITLFEARQEPAPLEEPSAIKIGGPTTAGPALQAGWDWRRPRARAIGDSPARDAGGHVMKMIEAVRMPQPWHAKIPPQPQAGSAFRRAAAAEGPDLNGRRVCATRDVSDAQLPMMPSNTGHQDRGEPRDWVTRERRERSS